MLLIHNYMCMPLICISSMYQSWLSEFTSLCEVYQWDGLDQFRHFVHLFQFCADGHFILQHVKCVNSRALFNASLLYMRLPADKYAVLHVWPWGENGPDIVSHMYYCPASGSAAFCNLLRANLFTPWLFLCEWCAVMPLIPSFHSGVWTGIAALESVLHRHSLFVG